MNNAQTINYLFWLCLSILFLMPLFGYPVGAMCCVVMIMGALRFMLSRDVSLLMIGAMPVMFEFARSRAISILGDDPTGTLAYFADIALSRWWVFVIVLCAVVLLCLHRMSNRDSASPN